MTVDATWSTSAPVVLPALRRLCGRYELRVAVGRAALGKHLTARRWARRAVRRFTRAGADRDLATALVAAAGCSRALGQLDAAAAEQQQALALLEAVAPQSAAWVAALIELADLRRFSGHHDVAEALLRRALDAMPHPSSDAGRSLKAATLNALGIVYKDTGRYDEAEALYSEALHLLPRHGSRRPTHRLALAQHRWSRTRPRPPRRSRRRRHAGRSDP